MPSTTDPSTTAEPVVDTPAVAPVSPKAAAPAVAPLSPPAPSRTRAWTEVRAGDGCEPPGELDEDPSPQLVERSFVFVDLCSFTRFCDTAGPAAATAELDRFRAQVRTVAIRRGVRVAKWLGDGAMLVALTPGPAIASAVEIVGRVADAGPLDARGAVCSGAALLFDGDDHIGLPVNLASRLCDAASAGEVLAPVADAARRPDWVTAGVERTVELRGLEVPTTVAALTMAS